MLDLNGDGVRTLAAAEGVMFDIDASGRQTKVGWAAGGDGLLVRDLNGDGQINDGRELFGGATQLANGQRAGDGFRALAELDSNGDGRIDAKDAAFGELKLWVDANNDGLTDAGELRGLADFGVVSLNLDFAKGSEMDNGNLLGLVSDYSRDDGSQGAMVDVWFAKAGEAAPTAADLLAGPAEELLGSPAGGGTAPTPVAAAQPLGGMRQSGLLDDDRIVPLI